MVDPIAPDESTADAPVPDSDSTPTVHPAPPAKRSDVRERLQGLPYNGPPDEQQTEATSDAHLVRLWLAEKSKRTQEEYSADVEQFADYVDLPFRYVTLGALQDYRQFLAEEKDYARSTQARKISAVKSLFTFGTKVRYFRHNVAAALTAPRVRSKRSERILAESELWEILVGETDLRNHVLLRLFYASGGRLSDIEGLQWKDFTAREDLEGPDGKGGGQVTFFGKGEKTRSVALYYKVWRLIRALRENERSEGFGGPEDPVFRSQMGGALSRTQIWRVVKKAATRAGVKTEETEDGRSPVSPHWFRHAHASHALQKGANLELVRETLGHTSIETTKLYLHARPDRSSSYYVDDAPGFRGDENLGDANRGGERQGSDD